MSEKSGKRERLKAHLFQRLGSQSPTVPEDSKSQLEPKTELGTSDSQNIALAGRGKHDAADIWDQAWATIQSEEPKLVQKYQQFLKVADSENTAKELTGKERQDWLFRVADSKVAIAKAKLETGGLDGRLRQTAKGILDVLIKVKDFAATLASSEPHVALVLAGYCAILPLLMNPITEQEVAIEGFADTTRILCRYTVIEADLFKSSTGGPLSDLDLVQLKTQLRSYLVQLYSKIIKFQIQLIQRYDRAAFIQFFRDVVQGDDWKSILKSIKDLEEANFRDVNTIGQHVLFHVASLVEHEGLQISAGFTEINKKLQNIGSEVEILQRQNAVQQDELIDSDSLNAFKGEVNYALQKDRNRTCVPGTGQWFFHHPEYESFQHGNGSQLLFVTAEAGGGKSTVMRTLADKLRDSNSLVAYFFFKDDDDRLRSYDEALSGLIYQILVQERKLLKHVQKIYKKHGAGVKHNTAEMWKALSEIAAGVHRDIFCVLDAVDECDAADRRQLVADMKDFFQDTRHSDSRLKFVVSSRPYRDENHQYDDLFSASTDNIRHLMGENAEVQSDIQKVIRSKAEELAQKRQLDHTIQELLVEKISAQNRNTRSFLAVQMAFELLDSHRRMHKGAGERTINIILADIPQSLGDQFDEMLSRSLDRQHARRIFCVILASRRIIKIEELKVIYALTESIDANVDPAQSYDDLELPPDDEEFKQLVRSRCGLFITFVRKSVHLFHQTAREHLLVRTQASLGDPMDYALSPIAQIAYQPALSSRNSWKASISLEDANLVCAIVCLDILNFTTPQELPWEAFDTLEAGNNCEEEMKVFASTRPFFVYAALNWYEHVTLAGDRASKTLGSDRHRTILDVSKPQFWAWSLTVAVYVCSSAHKKKLPISGVWTADIKDEKYRQYGLFVREKCIRELYPMDNKVRALLEDDGPKFTPEASSKMDHVKWTAEDGFHFIDRFHLAYGEYKYTSFDKAVHAIENGDKDRGSLFLANIPPHTLIWTSIANGAAHALKEALVLTKDIGWLHDIPDHILHRREKWGGWSSRSGKDLRKDRQQKWERSYPPTFAVLFRAGALASSGVVFESLADWIDAHALRRDFAQKLWDAGGFIITPLSRRLILAGASINCELWQDRRTALHIAATFWEHDTLQSLLDQGADSSKCTANGYNALHWFFHYEELYTGDTSGVSGVEAQVFRHLYKKSRITSSIKAIVNSVPDKYGLLNQPSDESMTPLMYAVQSSRSSPTGVKALLDEGAEVDGRDDQLRTALMHYIRSKDFATRNPAILPHLLRAGADSTTLDVAGTTVLGYLAQLLTSVQLSNFYPGFNKYNKAFHALTNIGPLSQRNVLVETLKGLKIPLVVAAQLGNASMCSALLAAGANPDEHGMEPNSPLRHNSGSESSALEDLEWSPLMVSLRASSYATAALLLESGANIKFRVRQRKRTRYNKYSIMKAGTTPLHIAISAQSEPWQGNGVALHTGGLSQGCSFAAVGRPDYPVRTESAWEILGRFQSSRPDGRNREDSDSDLEYETTRKGFANDSRGAYLVPYDTITNDERSLQSTRDPVLAVVFDRGSTQAQRQEALVEFMLSKGASVNACTLNNVTPLSTCVQKGLSNIVEILLKYNADPNIATSGGCTPLMMAAQAGRLALVKRLLVAGANPDAQLIVGGPNECKCSTFIDMGHVMFHSCDVPLTALAVAAESGHKDVVELLLQHGANPNLSITHHAHGRLPSARDKRRQRITPQSSDDDSGAEPELLKGFIGTATALTWARGEVRELLLRHGADPAKAEPLRECDCLVLGRRRERRGFGGSDQDYPTRSNSSASGDSDKDVDDSPKRDSDNDEQSQSGSDSKSRDLGTPAVASVESAKTVS